MTKITNISVYFATTLVNKHMGNQQMCNKRMRNKQIGNNN